MALNWDATKVRDFDKLTDEEAVIREALIWSTLGVGISRITEKNYKEFYARLRFIELLNGARRYKDEMKPKYFTLEEVERFIGLTTNASEFSRAQFIKRQTKNFFEEIERE